MGNGGETRRIQFTGKSSYIVTLPKPWVTDLGLRRGDPLTIHRQGVDGLQIYPAQRKSSPIQNEEATIEIANTEETNTTIRKLISLYFLGFKTIRIRPKDGRLDPQRRTAIKRAVKRMLMGSEIIADSTGEITIQVLVNLMELSIVGAFKRMVHLAKSMMADVMLAVKEENLDLAQEVINTDDEVDRFGFYIIRQIKIAIQNEHMLEEMGLKNVRGCLGYRVVVKNLERTGDHAAIIASNMLEFKRGVKKEVLAKLQAMCDFSMQMLDDACLSLFKEDFVQAEITIKRSSAITKYEKAVSDSCRGISDEETLFYVRRMSDNIRRIAEYASDIAEIVLNMNIEKALKKP